MRTAFRYSGYAIGFIVILAAIYVGAYYAMVERVQIGGRSGRMSIFIVHYRGDYRWVESFFAPMHAVDQSFRPKFWENELSLSDLDNFEFPLPS